MLFSRFFLGSQNLEETFGAKKLARVCLPACWSNADGVLLLVAGRVVAVVKLEDLIQR